MKKSQWLYEVAVYLLALLFLYTAFSKLVDLGHFAHVINNQPFPESVKPIVVMAIPAAEIITGILLLVIRTRLIGLIASALLMFSFSTYVGLAVFHFFKEVPCGCAGVFQGMSWTAHLMFNIAFFLLALIGLLLHSRKHKPDKAEISHRSIKIFMRKESGES